MNLFDMKYFFLKVSYEEIKLSHRGFIYNSEKCKHHLETIGTSFLDGYHKVLTRQNVNALIESLNNTDAANRGFEYEGASMAMSLLDFFIPWRHNHIKKFMTTTYGNMHIYMLHVGIGWAYARLPVNIEKRIKQYDPFLRWLIIDGYGFHQAYFKTGKYVYAKHEPWELKNESSRHVFYQGVGRCLWFSEGSQPVRISERIKTFPVKYRPDLWAGIGLASAYAGGIEKDGIIEIKGLSGKYLPHLMQGAAFAAKARDRANIVLPHVEMACNIICGISVKQAAEICDKSLLRVNDTLNPEEKFEKWRALIRESIYKKNEYEKISPDILN